MIGISICGIGKIGEVHVRNLAGLRGCRLTGLYDQDPSRACSLGSELSIPVYRSFKEVLADEAATAVVVATPSDSHASVACAAMQAGKHVFVEKPLASSLEDCEQILSVARSTGLIAQAGFCERFNPNHLEAKRAVKEGRLGEVRAIHTSRFAPYGMSDPAWPLGVLDTSVHNLDLILWLANQRPVSVLAWGTRVYPESDICHSATILLRFENGAMAVEHIAWLQDDGHPLNQCARSRMTVQGSKGAFFIDLHVRPSAYVTGGEYRQIDTVILGGPGYAGCLRAQFDSFLESIETGAPVLSPLEDAILTERVVIAAKESLASGKEVAV
ncbi:MAG: Gfo/Idh/MocA family oxidoreductase [Bryobacteraceae bacterium]|nr:Gfo/Idh/MocA family oxidoreductase [Bryobacteraceae bacterium]